MTREYEYTEIRRLLGRPKEQAPDSDIIVAAQIREEQFMVNRLGGTNKAWNPAVATVTTVANQAEYTITPAAGAPFGKATWTYRDLGSNIIVGVPEAMYGNEIANQHYEFVQVPLEAGMTPPYTGSRISYFRDYANVQKCRIYPIPEAAGDIYKIVYATGALDWSSFSWSDEPPLPEWSGLRCLTVALAVLPDCEWKGLSFEQNERKRAERSNALMPQWQRQEDEFKPFIRNPNQESSIDTTGGWYE